LIQSLPPELMCVYFLQGKGDLLGKIKKKAKIVLQFLKGDVKILIYE